MRPLRADVPPARRAGVSGGGGPARARARARRSHRAVVSRTRRTFRSRTTRILKLGGVVVPLNVLLKPREIAYHLKDSDAKALLVFEGTPELPMAEMAREACDEVPACRQLVVMTVDPAAPSPVERSLTLGQITARPAAGVSDARDGAGRHGRHPLHVRHDRPVEGRRAHAPQHDAQRDGVARHVARRCSIPASTRVNVTLITLPLFHSTGQTAQMNAGIAGGWTLVLLPRFEPAAVLRAFEDEHVNCWIGVPTMYWALLQHARKQQASTCRRRAASLRCCVSGGAPMPLAVLEDFERDLRRAACSRATACRRRRRSRASTRCTGRRSQAPSGCRSSRARCASSTTTIGRCRRASAAKSSSAATT